MAPDPCSCANGDGCQCGRYDDSPETADTHSGLVGWCGCHGTWADINPHAQSTTNSDIIHSPDDCALCYAAANPHLSANRKSSACSCGTTRQEGPTGTARPVPTTGAFR